MNESQTKFITWGMIGVAVVLLAIAVVQFMSYLDYTGKLDQAEALMGAEGRVTAHEMAVSMGQDASVVLPVILLLAAGALAFAAFRRMGK